MSFERSSARVGIYADVANMYRNGGQRLQYDILREFACRDGGEPARLNAYVTYDVERAEKDYTYRDGATSFHSKLRDYGYKVHLKEIRWYDDESGNRYGKANADLDLAVDALLQSERLDRVLLATGDGDFVRLVRAIQNQGGRVEVVGLNNVSRALREEADFYISGFLIPNMVPLVRMPERRVDWGEIGSRVRGWCYWFEQERSYGYFRFLRAIAPGLWLTDARHPDSPYETAFFRESQLPPEVSRQALPSRHFIFEFELQESERGEGLQAHDIDLVSRY